MLEAEADYPSEPGLLPAIGMGSTTRASGAAAKPHWAIHTLGPAAVVALQSALPMWRPGGPRQMVFGAPKLVRADGEVAKAL